MPLLNRFRFDFASNVLESRVVPTWQQYLVTLDSPEFGVLLESDCEVIDGGLRLRDDLEVGPGGVGVLVDAESPDDAVAFAVTGFVRVNTASVGLPADAEYTFDLGESPDWSESAFHIVEDGIALEDLTAFPDYSDGDYNDTVWYTTATPVSAAFADQPTPSAAPDATGWPRWEQTPDNEDRGGKPKKGEVKPWAPPTGDGVLTTPDKSKGQEGPSYRTKDVFGGPGKGFKLCVDYRFPGEPEGFRATPEGRKPSNQDFGNSGVYIFDRYEVQIIDPSRFDGDGGAVAPGGEIPDDSRNTVPKTDTPYPDEKNRSTPGGVYGENNPQDPNGNTNGDHVNNNRAPSEWNRLCVTFCPPELSPDKKTVVKPATITTVLNGVPVFNGPVPGGGTGGNKTKEPRESGHVYIQAHWGSKVEFRNMTVSDHSCS